MKGAYIFLFLLVLGCAQAPKEQEPEVKQELTRMSSPARGNSSLPYLVSGNDGELYLSWVEQLGDTALLKYSKWEGNSWSEVEDIASGTDWFVNWADYPMLAAGKDGQMIAHYLAKSSSGTYSYDVNITRKVGNTWAASMIPHKDGTPTEHGFATMIPTASSGFQLAWLDGRNTSGGHGEHQGAMTIRAAMLNDQGMLSNEVELDNRVCDCCQTGGAMTSNGPVVVYRDRSEMEVRDMSIVRLVNGEWTAPQTIYADNWKIEGCPVNGPRADAHGNTLAVAWFSAPNKQPKVKVIFSEDGGATFGNPVTIDNQMPLGRVDVVMIDEENAMVSWLGREGENSVIKARIVSKNGRSEPAMTIAQSNESRGSGFPQMAYHKGEMWFAWTDLAEDGNSVKVAKIGM